MDRIEKVLLLLKKEQSWRLNDDAEKLGCWKAIYHFDIKREQKHYPENVLAQGHDPGVFINQCKSTRLL